jgi:hypothetical protein
MVFVGGSKLRSRPHQVAAGGYLLVTLIYCWGAALWGPGENADPDAPLGAGYAALMIVYVTTSWLGGTLHTIYLQLRVAKLEPEPRRLLPAPHSADPAVAAAVWRAGRRDEARRLFIENPAMAWELRIGRPDIERRQYNDGGLVDVNHVPATWLAYALQIPQPLADEIVAARGRHHGFSSPEELIVHCDGMTPERLAMIGDFLVFRPR